ncbi:hypothetical protein ACHAXN_000276 [Cyclotella atomus]
MDGGTSIARRIQHFVRMLHVGLQTHHQRLWSTHGHVMNGNLPILLMGGDGNGCNVMKLNGAMRSAYHPELWHRFGNVNISNVIETHNHIYPWNTKIPKAVWRGSTTYDNEQYGNVSFQLAILAWIKSSLLSNRATMFLPKDVTGVTKTCNLLSECDHETRTDYCSPYNFEQWQ